MARVVEAKVEKAWELWAPQEEFRICLEHPRETSWRRGHLRWILRYA